jgi:uncharacterized membrane protein (UPF0127 family)
MAAKNLYKIVNVTRNTVLADKGELARSFFARGKGLMGRASLEHGFALMIYPETSIHTFFMRVPIDVLFVDRQGVVIHLVEAMPINRPFAGVAPWKGLYVIEMPAGVIAETGTQLGDKVEVSPPIS